MRTDPLHSSQAFPVTINLKRKKPDSQIEQKSAKRARIDNLVTTENLKSLDLGTNSTYWARTSSWAKQTSLLTPLEMLEEQVEELAGKNVGANETIGRLRRERNSAKSEVGRLSDVTNQVFGKIFELEEKVSSLEAVIADLNKNKQNLSDSCPEPKPRKYGKH